LCGIGMVLAFTDFGPVPGSTMPARDPTAARRSPALPRPVGMVALEDGVDLVRRGHVVRRRQLLVITGAGGLVLLDQLRHASD
jgi:hypothetical protein